MGQRLQRLLKLRMSEGGMYGGYGSPPSAGGSWTTAWKESTGRHIASVVCMKRWIYLGYRWSKYDILGELTLCRLHDNLQYPKAGANEDQSEQPLH